tara:strand:+ start:1556 stop:1807 length:252 start_codon:yes stop_codon:yes gene_type:complete
MIAYQGSFIKKDGSVRDMTFCRVKDLPDSYVASKITGTGKQKTLAEGSELVIDLEIDEFRVFNWEAAQGEVEELSIPDNYFDV